MISRQGFFSAICNFLSPTEGKLQEYMFEFAKYLSTTLFNSYISAESEDEELVDFSEICSGLSVLCGGSRDDKARAAFSLFDVNGTSTISLFDLSVYLTSVFRLRFWLRPAVQRQNRITAEELGVKTSREAFEEIGLADDDGLTFEQFKNWYEESGVEGEDGEEEEVEEVMPGEESPKTLIKVMSWKEIRELTKIKDYDISDMIDIFVSNVYSTGLVDVATLYRFFVNLNRGVGFQDADGSSNLHEKLKIFSRSFIEIFDDVSYEKGAMSARGRSVKFTDVVCALIVLCGGEKTAKMGHAFNIYDHDEDGYLSKAQITSLMKSIFVLQKFMDPSKMDDPEEVARATANEAWEQCNLNEAGEISLAVFIKWYSTPDDEEDDEEEEEQEEQEEDEDDEEDGYADEEEEEQEEEKRYELSVKDKLEATKVLLGLGSVTVDDLLEILSESAPDGR